AHNTVVGIANNPYIAASIQLRGTPTSYDRATHSGGMQVLCNVFAQSHDGALTQTEEGLVDAGQNAFNAPLQGFWNLGSGAHCDFDGDRVDDAFRASGAAWWYHSSLLDRWVALDTSASTDVTLSDVNGDGLCDATSGWTRYTTSPFASSTLLATVVPNVVGSSQAAATATLAGFGLVVGTVTPM